MENGHLKSHRNKNQPNKLIPQNISESLGKLPPQVREMEEAVLGAIMLEKEAINVALESSLQPDHFYDDRHKEIYTACLGLFSASEPIDLRTVRNQLAKTGKLELIGGAYFIAELTSKVSSAANISKHIRVVQEKFMARKLIEVASQIHHDAYEDTTDIFDLIEKASNSLYEMDVAKSSQKKILDMVTLMNMTVQNLQAKSSRGGLTGIASGFTLLDRITSGWQKSDLILVGARPGCGKSSWMLSVARTASKEHPVAIFSLEMSSIQLGERLISADYEIENDKMRSGLLQDHEWTRIGHDQTKLSSAKMYIDDTPAISIFELRTKCMRLKREVGLEMIIIDYLQLMTGERSGNREQEISSISKGLKGLAKELNIPVIALSQLSRAVETRADKRPMLSDLRESGSLEMDSDLVMFLYRPEYYKITVDENGMPTAGICEIDVAKHRNGGTGMVKVRFLKFFTKFLDLESDTLFGNDGTVQAPKTFFSKPKYDPSEARNKKDEPPPINTDDERPF